MMAAYRYTPRPTNRYAYIGIGAALLLAALAFLLSFFLPVYRGLMQLMSMMLLVVSIYIAVRFVFTRYTYIVMPASEDAPATFLVEQTQGKRTSLLYHVPLSAVLAITPWDKKKLPAGQFYAFYASISGGEYYTLHASVDGVHTVLQLEGDAEFVRTLRAYIETAGVPPT